MAQKPVLGKGLASLISGASSPAAPISPPAAPDNNSTDLSRGAGAVAAGPAVPVASGNDLGNRDRHPGISLAAIEEIVSNPFQPRHDFDDSALEELAQSIRSNGIIQPLVVRKRPQGGFELIAGERRLRAAKLAQLKQVPVVIRRSNDRESLELALIENIQRQNLNCIDEALAYSQLVHDYSLTQEEISTQVGKDRATIANHLRLLRLPEAIIDDLKRGILTFGHGRALLGVEDQDLRLQIRAVVVEKRLSVRDTEFLVEQHKERLKTEGKGGPSDSPAAVQSAAFSRLAALSQELTRFWSAKVELKGSERKGKIVIHYKTREDLDRILDVMKN